MVSAFYSLGDDDNYLLILNDRNSFMFFKPFRKHSSRYYFLVCNSGNSKLFVLEVIDDVKSNCFGPFK